MKGRLDVNQITIGSHDHGSGARHPRLFKHLRAPGIADDERHPFLYERLYQGRGHIVDPDHWNSQIEHLARQAVAHPPQAADHHVILYGGSQGYLPHLSPFCPDEEDLKHSQDIDSEEQQEGQSQAGHQPEEGIDPGRCRQIVIELDHLDDGEERLNVAQLFIARQAVVTVVKEIGQHTRSQNKNGEDAPGKEAHKDPQILPQPREPPWASAVPSLQRSSPKWFFIRSIKAGGQKSKDLPKGKGDAMLRLRDRRQPIALL